MNKQTLDPEHYFNDFSNEELIEVVEKPYEWSSWDVQLAKDLLQEKGIAIDEKRLQRLKSERQELMAEPEKANEIWITLGYIFAIIGGLFAIMIAWPLASSKKTLPDGKKVYVYDRKSRYHAKNILIIGTFTISILFLLKILYSK